MIAQQLINTTRRRLRAGVATGEQLNQLKTGYTPGDGVLSFVNPLQAIQAGTRIAAGLNIFHVISTSATSNSVKVIGGIDGANDDPIPTGALVRVKPRWTDYEIFTAINDDLASLSAPASGLFQVLTAEITFNAAVRGYDLGNLSIIRILDVRYQTQGPEKNWPRAGSWRLDRSANQSDFPSGTAIRIDDGGWPGLPVQVVYAAPFSPLTTTADDVAGTGLSDTSFRLPPLGAAIQLQAGVDIERTRTDSQPISQKADAVPAQTPGLAIKAIAALRQQWINEEAGLLLSQWPPRQRSR